MLHRLTGSMRCLPDFLVIGAQKSGTTSLADYLGRNPGVWFAPCKECNHFSGPQRPANAYRGFFPTRRRRRIMEERHGGPILLGEGTPYDLFHPRAAEAAFGLLPDARLLILLRNPIDRAHSHYRHCVRLGLETLSFEEALAAEGTRLEGEEERLRRDPRAVSDYHRHYSYVARGLYARQLERWLKWYPREQVQVTISEALFGNPEPALARIEEFLRLAPGDAGGLRQLNRGTVEEPFPDRIREGLRSVYREENRRLAEMLEVRLPWDDEGEHT